MTPAEMVTTFAIAKTTTKRELCDAIVEHLKEKGIVAEEYDMAPLCWSEGDGLAWNQQGRIFAMAQEGNNEGYYVHLGTIDRHAKYECVGLAKMYSAELAYRMCTEVQRFLCAMVWNPW